MEDDRVSAFLIGGGRTQRDLNGYESLVAGWELLEEISPWIWPAELVTTLILDARPAPVGNTGGYALGQEAPWCMKPVDTDWKRIGAGLSVYGNN